MSDNSEHDSPVLQMAGLQVDIHGCDEEWFSVTASCSAPGSTIRVEGPLLYRPALTAWREALKAVYDGASERAELGNLEPELDWSVERRGSLGHLVLEVEITPDHFTQQHRLRFEIDQSYVPGILAALRRLVEL